MQPGGEDSSQRALLRNREQPRGARWRPRRGQPRPRGHQWGPPIQHGIYRRLCRSSPPPGQQQELVFCPKATGGCGGAAHPGQQQVLVTAQENRECGEAAAPGPAGAGLTAQEYFSTIVFMAGIVDCFNDFWTLIDLNLNCKLNKCRSVEARHLASPGV